MGAAKRPQGGERGKERSEGNVLGTKRLEDEMVGGVRRRGTLPSYSVYFFLSVICKDLSTRHNSFSIVLTRVCQMLAVLPNSD